MTVRCVIISVVYYNSSTKRKGKTVLVHMEAFVGVDVYLHLFFMLALVGDKWPASHPCCFISGERSSLYPFSRRRIGEHVSQSEEAII